MINELDKRIKKGVKFSIIIYTILIILGIIFFIFENYKEGISIIVLAYIGIIMTYILNKIPEKEKKELNNDKSKNK